MIAELRRRAGGIGDDHGAVAGSAFQLRLRQPDTVRRTDRQRAAARQVLQQRGEIDRNVIRSTYLRRVQNRPGRPQGPLLDQLDIRRSSR